MKDVFGSHTTCWKVRLLTIHGLCSPHGHGLQVASGKMPTTSNERFLKPLCFYPLCIWGMVEENFFRKFHGGREFSRQEQEVCSWIFKHGNGNYIWTASRTTALLLQCILRLHAIVIQGLTGPFFFYTSSSIITSTAQVTTYFSNCLLFCANKPLKRVS